MTYDVMNSGDDVFRSVVTVSVEKALLEVGKFELDSVVYRLKENYNCEISDCLAHPEYLKEILCELFGNSHEIILNSIQESFAKTRMEQPLVNFLNVLGCKC